MNVCRICSHPERAAIDAALLSRSIRDVAGQYELSKSALDRHKAHIPKALTKAKQAVEVAEATTLLSRVEKLLSRCETIFDRATAEKKWGGAVAAARELRGCLELIGKLSGELQSAGVNVSINQAFANISIRDLSDRQLNELVEVLSYEQRIETGLVMQMSDEEINAELMHLVEPLRCSRCKGELTYDGQTTSIR